MREPAGRAFNIKHSTFNIPHLSVILSEAKDLRIRIRRSFVVFATQDDVVN